MKTKKIHIRYIVLKLLMALLVISSFMLLEQQPDIALAEKQLKQAQALVESEAYEQAKPMLLEVAGVFERTENWDKYIEATDLLDECYFSLELFEEGITFFSRAIKLTPTKETIDQFRAAIWLRLAFNYHAQGDYKNAIWAYESGLPYAEKLADSDKLVSYYGSLGYLYWDQGNHEKALDIQYQSLKLALQKKQKDHAAELMSAIGDSYRTMGKKDSCFAFFRRSLALKPESSQAYIQFSKAYQEFGMMDSAVWILSKAIPLLHTDTEKADSYYQYARLLYDQKKPDKAIPYIQQAITFGEKGYGPEHSEMGRILRMAGFIYRLAGMEQQALGCFQHVLEIFSQGDTPLEDVTQNPPLELLEPDNYWVLGALEGKGIVFYQAYLKTGDVRQLHLAMSQFETGISYGEKMRLEHSYTSSKLEFYEYFHPLIEGAITTALALSAATSDRSYLEKAFLLSERSKAAVLSEELYDKEVKHVAGIPDEVLEQGRALQEKVNEWAIETYNDPLNEDSLREARISYDRWKTDLKQQYPKYYELVYAYDAGTDMAQIRSALQEGDLAIQYFIGTDTLYSFALSARDLQVFRTPLDTNFIYTLESFRRSTGDWAFVNDSTEVAERQFLASAPQLYQWLLAQPLQQMPAKRLIIVPDGELGLIPFGALLDRDYQGSWKSLDVPYLIKKYPISYSWSAGFIGRRNTEEDAKPQYGFGGFGTEYDQATLDLLNGPEKPKQSEWIAMRDFGALPFADDEVKSVGRKMRGKTWLNANATKKNFLENAPHCGVLHIAAHGILEEGDPMLSRLVFNRAEDSEDIQLYANELYNMTLKARLAVLSACNSGNGQAEPGEGVMSLARAFAYAGCPSLVTSLWKVSDQSAASLMAPFYQQLSQGRTIDESLRSAQLQYLEHTSAEFSLPVYWSGFVVVGQREALPKAYFKTSIYWKLAMIIALVAAGLLAYKMKKKKG